MLAVAVVLVLLHRLEEREAGALPLGVAVAAAFAVRPTNTVVVLAVTAYVALRHIRELPRYLAGAALVAAPFVLHSVSVWGAPLPPYFAPARVAHAGTFAEALAGNLVSPARGLLVYSPILILVPVGIVLAVRRGTRRPLVVLAVGIVVAHWLVISSFPHWWGGWCYGPRLFTDMTPLLVWLLLPALDALGRVQRPWRIPAVAAVGLLAAVSVAMHFRGAVDTDTGAWNARPVSVDDAPGRLWDWSDPPFLR